MLLALTFNLLSKATLENIVVTWGARLWQYFLQMEKHHWLLGWNIKKYVNPVSTEFGFDYSFLFCLNDVITEKDFWLIILWREWLICPSLSDQRRMKPLDYYQYCERGSKKGIQGFRLAKYYFSQSVVKGKRIILHLEHGKKGGWLMGEQIFKERRRRDSWVAT